MSSGRTSADISGVDHGGSASRITSVRRYAYAARSSAVLACGECSGTAFLLVLRVGASAVGQRSMTVPSAGCGCVVPEVLGV